MSVIDKIKGRVVPVPGNDIDTDRIIPARFLRCVTFEGLGEAAFLDDREAEKGEHPFDLPQHQGASILVSNRNFGCGSSREHAPQALKRWGIKAVVAESFAEIFHGNCAALGLPCMTLSSDELAALQAWASENPDQNAELNIETAEISFGSQVMKGKILEGFRRQFLNGEWDALGQLLENSKSVEQCMQKIPYVNGFRVEQK